MSVHRCIPDATPSGAGVRRASKRVRGGRHPAPHLHRSCRQSSNEAGLLDACLRVDIYQDVLVSSHSRRLRGPRTLAPWRGRFVVRALFPHTARIIRDLLRAGMSAYRRIPDMVQRCVEHVLMTPSRHSSLIRELRPSDQRRHSRHGARSVYLPLSPSVGFCPRRGPSDSRTGGFSLDCRFRRRHDHRRVSK